ncbi:MAG TPA: hypothetical protein VGK54_04970 [Chloroflexota bacterium]|jgi:hypothetical protein
MTTPSASGGNRLPRDAAGHLDLNEGTGGIIAMCSCDGFLEVYKQDLTYRIQTPETIDPDRINPHTPFVAAVTDNVGSSNPIVARVLLQGLEILNGAVFDRPIDKEAVIRELHAIKEALVACYKVSERVVSHVARVVDDGEKHGLSGDDRGSLNPFPQVPDLEADATTFLIHAKRAIRRISQLPSIFFSVPRDSDFDHLLKRLEKVAAARAMMKFVRDNAPGIRYLSELRNCQEHPKKGRHTMIDNFKVLPNGSVAVPMWYVSGETPRPVAVEMRGAIEFLIMMAEAMLIHLVMACVMKNFPFVIQPIEPVNPTNPMKYRISVDMKQLNVDSPRPPENTS